jgi:hypothetical protein
VDSASLLASRFLVRLPLALLSGHLLELRFQVLLLRPLAIN